MRVPCLDPGREWRLSPRSRRRGPEPRAAPRDAGIPFARMPCSREAERHTCAQHQPGERQQHRPAGGGEQRDVGGEDQVGLAQHTAPAAAVYGPAHRGAEGGREQQRRRERPRTRPSRRSPGRARRGLARIAGRPRLMAWFAASHGKLSAAIGALEGVDQGGSRHLECCTAHGRAYGYGS